MIETKKLFKFLKKNKINFYTGVPDSVLKETKTYLEKIEKKNHIIASNEGSAVATAIGYHLSTKKLPCVYFQNSGLGNAINPLISIAHKKVYSIPLLLLIGWRGAPGKKDEPQHLSKGFITPELLKLLNIRYCTLNSEKDFKKLKKLLIYANKNNVAVACLIKKDVLFKKKDSIEKKALNTSLVRKRFDIDSFLVGVILALIYGILKLTFT